MITLTDSILAFIIVLFILLLLYLTGRLFNKAVAVIFRISNQNMQPIYWDFAIGLILWISIYAIFTTRGLTLLLPIPFLCIAVSFYLQCAKTINPISKIRPVLFNVIFFALSLITHFVYFLYTFTSFNSQKIKYLSGDFNIYHRMANRLNTIRVEAYNFNAIDNSFTNLPHPYHFGDIWFYALINRLTPINPTLTFLISFSVLSVIFTLGMLAFISNLFAKHLDGQKHKLLYLLIFSGLFGGFSYCFPIALRDYAEPYTLSIFNWGKVLVLSTIIIGILSALSSKSIYLSIYTITILALLYINAIPAIFGATFLLLTTLLFFRKITQKEFFSSNLIYFGVTISIVVFLYKLYPIYYTKIHGLTLTHSTNENYNLLSFSKYLKILLHIFIGGWFQVLTISPYLLIFLIVFLCKSNRNKFLLDLVEINWAILFLPLLFLSGLVSWAILFPISVDSVQFFHNILAPIYSIGISLILFYVLTRQDKIIIKVIMIIFCILGVQESMRSVFYASEFLKSDWEKLSFFFQKSQSHRVVNLRSMHEFDYWSAKKTDQYIPLGILCYLWSDYQNICLNTPYIHPSNSLYSFEEKKDIDGSSFSTFRNRLIKHGFNDESVIQKQFFNLYQPNYIFVSNDTSLPAALLYNVVDSLQIKNSDFTIYKFK